MIPGVPSMLIHILRCLRTIPKAPGMTDTLLQFQIIIIIIIITKLHFFCYITFVLLQPCVLLML